MRVNNKIIRLFMVLIVCIGCQKKNKVAEKRPTFERKKKVALEEETLRICDLDIYKVMQNQSEYILHDSKKFYFWREGERDPYQTIDFNADYIFSPDGKSILSQVSTNIFQLRRITQGRVKFIKSIYAAAFDSLSIRYSYDSEYFVVSDKRSISLYKTKNGEFITSFITALSIDNIKFDSLENFYYELAGYIHHFNFLTNKTRLIGRGSLQNFFVSKNYILRKIGLYWIFMRKNDLIVEKEIDIRSVVVANYQKDYFILDKMNFVVGVDPRISYEKFFFSTPSFDELSDCKLSMDISNIICTKDKKLIKFNIFDEDIESTDDLVCEN